MAKYPDKDEWIEEILIPDRATPILGGQPVWEGDRLVDGFANVSAGQLANRTRHLKNKVEQIESDLGDDFSAFMRKEENLLDLEDIGQAKYNLELNLVDNTRDLDKPVSVHQQAALDAKVDKVAGYGLSQEDYTSAEKTKLNSLEGSKFKGEYVSLAALQLAQPSPEVGSFAYVDAGVGEVVSKYIWDSSDSVWVKQQGESASLTPTDVKNLYESNPDTNSFTDGEKTKLGGIQAGATANATNARLRDRSTHTGTQGIDTISGLQAELDGKKDVNWQPTNASKAQALSGVTNAFVSGSSYHNIISWNAINATAGTLTLNLDVSLNHDITVDEDFTVIAPTNADPGKTGDIVLRVTGGDRIVSWSTEWKFLSSVPDIGEEDSMWVVSYKVLSPTEILASASKVV